MAKNTSESRIPLPRAARPSFLPKPKIISPGQKQTGGISGGGNSRRSTILAGCFLTDHNLDLETPRRKFCGNHLSNSTPFSGSDRASHVPSIWSLKSNDCHQRDLTCDKDGDLFTNIPKDQTLLEDIGDSCLIDPSRNGTSEIFNSLCKDQTLLEDISCVIYPSYSSTIHETSGAPLKTHQFLCLTKQNSFECDESLGILTPDQMTDFTVAQGCSRTPSCENLSGSRGLQPATTTSSSQGSRPTDIQFSGGNTEGQILLSERSPSLEELPLDPKPVEKLLEQQIVAPLIATVPSTTTSANALPMSFVTSATSIASLEAGYQGDGENSRPASRGADPPRGSIPGNLPTSCRLQDPMTDSDFFTESDADAHEDIGRGDRKAQVIDGTLFCAPTEPRRRCPSFAGEEMDSSGIYSDLDKRQDERFNGEINEDRSPDTANTPDTVDTQDTQVSLPAAGQLSPGSKQEMPPITMDFLQVQNNPLENSHDSSTSINHEITVIQVGVPVSTNRSFLGKHSPNKTDSSTLIKYKMPKKNVESKIKAMISTTKDDSAKETKRAPRRKNGHWDAIMSKIEAGKTEQRSRPQRKEVKSRVMQSLTASASSTPTTSSSSASSKRTSEESNSGKAGSDKRRIRARQGITSPNQETARSSVRSSLSDISAPPAKTVPKRSVTAVNQQRRAVNGRSTTTNLKTRLVTNDAKKSGTLDLSPLNLEKSPRPIRKSASLLRRPATTNNNGIVNSTVKQTPTGLDKDILRQHESNSSTTISPAVSSIDTCQQATQTDCEISDVLIDSKQTETAVGALCLTIQYLSRQNDEYSKKVQEALSSAASTKSNLEEKLSSEQEAHEKALRDLCTTLESKHASRIEELENALSKERSVFEERLRESLADLQRQHEEAIDRLKAQHNEELEAKKRAFEEETKQQATQQLDNKYEEELIALKVELKDMRATVKPIFVIKNRIIDKLKHENSLLMKQMKEQRNKIQRLENELEEAKNSNQLFSIVSGDHSSSLQDEIWSLRSVLELRSQENSSLRSEMEILRDELEQKVALEQRVETLEARCEDLKAQLESKDSYERDISQQNELVVASLHEISKHNKRLAQKNEELVYRLRQKSEVVSVLANQLATPPRLSRSLGPENIEHTPEKPASSSSPMIKFMVQKGDSVSWTLEIDESCEAQPKNNGATTPKVPRANSMRMPPRKANDFRARSKSVSTAESMKENNWGSMYSSTPVPVRRRPRSDPFNSPAVQQAVNTSNELQAGPRPQEAGGEAMISEETSATSSDDESSASTDMPRLSMEFGWSDPAE